MTNRYANRPNMSYASFSDNGTSSSQVTNIDTGLSLYVQHAASVLQGCYANVSSVLTYSRIGQTWGTRETAGFHTDLLCRKSMEP